MAVGSEIRAVCKKCGDVWHVVIALADRRIAKVECMDCGARHRYRTIAGGIGSLRGNAAARATPRSGGDKVKRGRDKEKQIVAADESRPRRDFCMSETYQVGDRVVHASFGQGVVQEIAGPAKIVVFFAVGWKTLVHGRRGK